MRLKSPPKIKVFLSSKMAWCVETHDLAASKLAAYREKDIEHRRLEKVFKWLVHSILSTALFLGGSMSLSREIGPLVGGISFSGICDI